MRRILTIFLALTFFASPSYAQDWSTQGGQARRKEIIRRFKLLLERTPTEGMAFKRLVAYVGAGKKLDSLVNEYKKKVKKHPKKVNFRLILGHLLKKQSKYKEAFVEYEKAVELAPKKSLSWMSRGSIYLLLKKMDLATKDFEKALSLEKNKDKKQEILRKLADSAFAQRDWEKATNYYDQLVALNPRSEYLRLEYAQILIQYKRYDKALIQYKSLLKMAGRDVKTRATTMRDMGDLYEKMGKDEVAIKTYKKAQSLMKKNHWLHRALEERIVGVYRRGDRLQELIKSYEKKWRRPSYTQAMLLGDLYDEIGNEKGALKQYRIAISKNRRQPDPRVKVIRMLERSGDDKKVQKAYEDLVRVAPGESQYQFELVKVYFRSGNKKKATSLLSKIERRFRRSTDTYIILADSYANYGLKKSALRIYKRLIHLEPKNDAFILALGEYYFQEGKTKDAVKTWVRLLKSNLEKGEAYARLGQVLAEHGMVDQGLDYFEKAVKIAPKDDHVRRGLALAYERSRRTEKAIETWKYLLTKTDKSLIRNEARTRIIGLYYRKNVLRKRMRKYEMEFEKGNIDSGFFLAAAHIKYSEYKDAENILRKIQNIAQKEGGESGLKKEVMALNSLEKLFTRSGELKKSITILENLAELIPLRKREYYQQIAEHSLKLFEDDKAVHYATLAVKANPDDAASQARLGRVYIQMGNLKLAAEQFRKAIDIDPRAFDIQFQLAEILVSLEKFKEAEKLFKVIVKKAPGGSVIEKSAKYVINLAEVDNRLVEIESEFFPLVYRTPPQPIYRDIMLEIYERLSNENVDLARFGNTKDKKEAKQRLTEIGRRGLPIFVDALQSRSSTQRSRALRLVTNLRAKGAALTVSRIADDPKDPLRILALVAAARIGDHRSSSSMSRASKDGKLVIRNLSIWGLGSTGGSLAEKRLSEILNKRGAYDEQLLAALSLGRIGSEKAKASLRSYYQTHTSKSNALLMTIWSMGRAKDALAISELEKALQDPYSSQIAAWSLAEIGGQKAIAILLSAFWNESPLLRKNAEQGLQHLFSRHSPFEVSEEIQHESTMINLRGGWFDTNLFSKRLFTNTQKISTNIDIQKLEKAAGMIVQIARKNLKNKSQSKYVIQSFACPMGIRFGNIVPCGSSKTLTEKVKTLTNLIRQHASKDDPSTYLILGEIGSKNDIKTLKEGMHSKDIAVRKAAIQGLGSIGGDGVQALVSSLSDPSPEIRAQSAMSIGVALQGDKNTAAHKSLISLLDDSYHSVQIAATEAIALLKLENAVEPLLEKLQGAPRSLTIVIVYALNQIGTPATESTLSRYKTHADLRVRNAAFGKYPSEIF